MSYTINTYINTCIKYEHYIYAKARVAQCVRQLDYLTTHTSLSTIRRGFAPGFINYKKGALDPQPQVIKFTSCLPMVGAWFSPGTPASSTTKTGRHDIAEILLIYMHGNTVVTILCGIQFVGFKEKPGR